MVSPPYQTLAHLPHGTSGGEGSRRPTKPWRTFLMARAAANGLAALPNLGAPSSWHERRRRISPPYHLAAHISTGTLPLLLPVLLFTPGEGPRLIAEYFRCQLEKTFAKFTKEFIFTICRRITTLLGDIIGGGVVYDPPLACVVFYQVFIKFLGRRQGISPLSFFSPQQVLPVGFRFRAEL